MGITLDHSQNLSGFGGSGLQVKGFVPFTVTVDLRTLSCSHTCSSVTAALGDKCAAPECPLLVTLQLVTVFFEANKVAWRPASPITCDTSDQVLSSFTFFPNFCGLCKSLPNSGAAHHLLQSLSGIISWNTAMDPLHSQPTFSLCSSCLWPCALRKHLGDTMPKVGWSVKPNSYIIPFSGWMVWWNEQ